MQKASDKNANKYTIGKFLRNKKRLHKADPTAEIVDPPESLQKYMNYLFEQGVSINKMAFARFRLKNNLPYHGLIATQKVFSDEIILRVPCNLILNTRKAFFSELRQVFYDNPSFFSVYQTSQSEDHMLLVYILSEYSKGEASEYYHLISNLPRDIDYIVFWDNEELKMLEDQSAVRIAKDHRKEYDEDENFVIGLSQKYPDLLKPEVFTRENIRWIYTHLVTRCFGKYLEYITMIPVAELFNHECIDVYYDLEYYADNPNMPKDYKMDAPEEVEDESVFDTYDTSEGTNESEDEEFDSDFEYDKDGVGMELENETIEKKLDGLSILDEIRMRRDDLEHFVINELDWGDGFSVFFVREVCKEASDILEKYKKKEMTVETARNLFMNLETSMVLYKNEVRKFYKKVYKIPEDEVKPKQKAKFKKEAEEKEKKEYESWLFGKPNEEMFDAEKDWKKDKFDNFVMKASWKDQFEPGSQLFFCYGRLSNRTALLRYGIALEYNKYEHVHLKIPYLKFIKNCDWLVDKIKYFKLSRYMRFKLKRTKMNISLINFCKGQSFQLDYTNYENVIKPVNVDLELQAVRKSYEYIQEYLGTFSRSPEENRELLKDESIGYHEYFATVYKLERQRVLEFHSKALLVVEEILKRLKKGLTLEFAVMRVHDLETDEECNRNRIFIADYLDLLKDQFGGAKDEGEEAL